MFIIYDIEVTEIGQFIGFKINNNIKYISLLDRINLIEFIKFIKEKNYILVAYNNYSYDNKILNYCMYHKNLTQQDIIKFSNNIINKTSEVKEIEFNINLPVIQDSKVENLDLLHMMNTKQGLKLKSFLNYKYLFKNSLCYESIEELKKYNLEDLELTERIFKDEFEEEYLLNLYLSEYLEFGKIGHKNLIISKFLKEKATYNTNFDFKYCLDKIAIDEDLKELAVKLINNNKLTQVYTQDKILIKKGGLHFPISSDFKKQGIQYYKECFNYDFSSYYPNLYINLLDFFSPETKEYLQNILNERLEAKKTGDDKKNKALKLFINSVYGQLKSLNQEYMFAVAILGQVLFVQLMRDNNINLGDVVELNTDGILLKNKLQNIKNISNIEIEEEIFTDVYHKNSNNKTYILNNKPVVKGQLLGGNEYTNKLVFKDLSACLYGGKIYNCFIVKHKNKDEFDQIKYYKFRNIEDIKNYSLGHNGILMAKSVFEDAILNNILEEISEYNYEDITTIVTDLFNAYLKENQGYKLYINNDFALESKLEEVNKIYNKYKDKLYLLPNNKNICIQHKNKAVHNELAFYNNQAPKNLFIVPVDEFVIVEVNHDELANKKVKEILISKNAKYFIYKKPNISMKLRCLKGLKYYTGLKVSSIKSSNEFELVNEELPEVFYKANNEELKVIDFVGMTPEALNEKNRVVKNNKKAIGEKSEEVLLEKEETKIRRNHYLDDKQLKINIAKVTEFLGILDPNTVEFDYYGNTKFVKFPKELRAIKREKQDKNYINSSIYYSLITKNSRDYLNNFFEKLNGSGYCAYYSVFNFKPERGIYQNKIKSKKITNKTSKATMILPMDFDDISEEKYLKIKERFTNLGLETLDIFTGHGYQMIILLKKYCFDKDVLKKFTNLLTEKGFPVDEAIIDSARIMRLPYTYNCKCLDKTSKYYGKEEPILTTIINKTRTRYFIDDVFKKLSSLKAIEQEVIEEKEVIQVPEEKIIQEKVKINELKEIKNKENQVLDFVEPITLSNNKIRKLQDLYAKTGINVLELEPVIQNILTGTKEGMRHDVLLFIMPYFKNYKKYSLEQIQDILTIWGSQCKPVMLPSEIKTQVKSLYSYENMTAPYGIYSDNLKKEYGVFRLNASKNQSSKIYITNDIIKNLDKIPSKTLKIYIALMLENQETGVNKFTINDINKIVGISISTFTRSIKYLKKHKYIKVNKNSKRNGEKYEYSINLERLNFNKTKFGFVAISQDILKKALNMLKTGEIYTWLYISMVQGTTKKVCKLNQYQIGSKVKRTNITISYITSSLAKKGFITKITDWKIKDIANNTYKQYCLYDTLNISQELKINNKLVS